VECRTRAETHLTHIVSALALEGVGIGVVDLLATEAHAARGGVARPLAAEVTLEIRLVLPAASPPPAMLQALIRLCDEAIDALTSGP
jgi:DNA-binding transcriptional LysR family regulator